MKTINEFVKYCEENKTGTGHNEKCFRNHFGGVEKSVAQNIFNNAHEELNI